VDGDQLGAGALGRAHRAGDGGGDVVQLEVEHDPPPLPGQRGHGGGALGAEQLQAHLDHAGRLPRRQ